MAVNMNMTRDEVVKLYKLYIENLDKGPDHVLEFKGQKFLMSYTKYLLQYLYMQDKSLPFDIEKIKGI